MSQRSLGEAADEGTVLPSLMERGLSRAAASDKGAIISRAAGHLRDAGYGPATQVEIGFVPGRIEVLGKHTDYAGGRSLLLAVEKGFCMVAAPRLDSTLRMYDVVLGDSAAFEIRPDLVPEAGHWANYPQTVARRLARNFPGQLFGADVAFGSDLPGAAGMSSSSALLVATFLTLAAVNRLADRREYCDNIHRPEDLAGYLGTVENGMTFASLCGDRGVGTFGGSEDHTAMLCARAERVVQYSYCPVRFERTIELPVDHVWAVAVSGVVADKTGSAMAKYNRVSQLARAAIEVWRGSVDRTDAHLAMAIASAPGASDRVRQVLRNASHPDFTASELVERFEQFHAESEEIIPAVADVLVGAEIERFGELTDRSQALGAELLHNQTPETIWLAAEARTLGAAAASAFGAGFGGSVWALVKETAAPRLLDAWSQQYRRAFPEPAARSSFFVTRAGPAAFQLR